MAVSTPTERAGLWPERVWSALGRQGALVALLLLVLFGALRYRGFFGVYNITELLRYNAMFGLVALGMTFVIMTGGIDLSVGSTAALTSVVAALLSPYGVLPAVAGAVLAGLAVGLLNGAIIAYLAIPPFITTLAMLLGARGLALLLADNAAVSVSSDAGFPAIGSRSVLGLPIPVVLLLLAYAAGWLLLNYTRFGRHVLAIGGNEEATRLMGLPVDRIKLAVYALSGTLAGAAGVLLASLTFTGLPTEGVGWELSAIAAVVVGGTLLTGGVGSVGATLVGVLLLGLIFNLLNFENGQGLISLSPYWQSVIRGAFLLAVIILQSRLARRREV
jgi:ribose/xylose/arabinose/galactoside ABC-type transport system permease subunit